MGGYRITLLTYKTMFPSDNSCTFNCACEKLKILSIKEMNNMIRKKKDFDGIPSRPNHFKSPMFSYLSWNCVNIDIIFYRVNNSVAAILSIISIIQHLRRRSFLFFFLHRTIETIKPLCVYQFPGYHNRVETSIFNISSLYRRVYKAVTTSRVVGELSAPLSVHTLTAWCWPPEVREFYSLSSPSTLYTSLPIACSTIKVFIACM